MSYPEAETPEEVAFRIKSVLAEKLNRTPESIRLEDDLLVDLGLDSLAIPELLSVMEQHGRPVSADVLLDVTTVGDLVRVFSAAGTTR